MRTFKQHLEEAKQVGIIYHFTSFDKMIRILEADMMKSEYGYISFTRNYKLAYGSNNVRITFDGDKMSNKFKIAPFVFVKDRRRYGEEMEERIVKERIYGVIKYIKQIDIITPKIHQENFQTRWNNFKEDKKLKLDLIFVDNWKPVK